MEGGGNETTETTSAMSLPSPPPKRLRTGSPTDSKNNTNAGEGVSPHVVTENSSNGNGPDASTAVVSSSRLDNKEEPPSSADTPESSPVARSPTASSFSVDAELPPAPPSTPASVRDVQSSPNDDEERILSYPADSRIIENASELERALHQSKQRQEQQQYLAEEPTPHPSRKNNNNKSSTATQPGRPPPPPLTDDFSEWAVGDRYEMIRMLGRGSYGEVAQAKDLWYSKAETNSSGSSNNATSTTSATPITTKSHSQFVAIKRITSAFEQEIDAIRLYREMHILRHLSGHECIIHLLDIVQPPTDDPDDFHDLYLVFEYVDTDLYKLIMSPQYLTTEHIQTFLYQMLAGLKYIHSASVIHRDLKPANILLNEDCSLKICDFGLARILTPSHAAKDDNAKDDNAKDDSTNASEGGNDTSSKSSSSAFGPAPRRGLTRQLTKHVVTRWYRAPELILVQPYTTAVDIWSLGCILAELLSMQEGNVPDYQDRMPLFPGGSCYPLSGEGTSMNKEERVDQLSVIFGVIGIPDDLESIGMASSYRKAILAKGDEITRRPLDSIYPASDSAAIDLLKRMLEFNPQQRCTADEALQHSFFQDVRGTQMEVVADGPLQAPEFLDSRSIGLDTLKHRIMEEVRCFEHGDAQEKHGNESRAAAATSTDQ